MRALTLRIVRKPFVASRFRIEFVIPSDRPLRVRDLALLHHLVVTWLCCKESSAGDNVAQIHA